MISVVKLAAVAHGIHYRWVDRVNELRKSRKDVTYWWKQGVIVEQASRPVAEPGSGWAISRGVGMSSLESNQSRLASLESIAPGQAFIVIHELVIICGLLRTCKLLARPPECGLSSCIWTMCNKTLDHVATATFIIIKVLKVVAVCDILT